MKQLIPLAILCCIISFFDTYEFRNQECFRRSFDIFINDQFVTQCGWGMVGLFEVILDVIIFVSILFDYFPFFRRLLSLLLLSQVFIKFYIIIAVNQKKNFVIIYFILGSLLHFLYAVSSLLYSKPSKQEEKLELRFSNVRIPGSSKSKPKTITPKPECNKTKTIKISTHAKESISALAKQIEQLNKEADEKHRLKNRNISQSEVIVNPQQQEKKQLPVNQKEQIEELLNEETTLINVPKRRITKKKVHQATKVIGDVKTQNETQEKKKVISLESNKTKISLNEVLQAKSHLKPTKK
ncbi:hypothetical protein EHI8A_005950 [Entamoeba histolytica HM-1:IMSS-B]|uniref:Transmembrane protein n=6 Tax=Entamoeba histolytica TaxID=5759 RepID=C4M508_ENTH1|nr:hypothetical protein EHI_141010 [Entamoeba histolytica HM-1:IMSS]EMD43131.1 Hypothetical protein EHI5A_009030 [Entamoeba histolytica KU27]EMH76921.1 hypothetical protein EHI8A_005950 [Entamoeba histolytica HM-1:IMSS-B]EMS17731.1 hypothetical protein KM1_008460 [Entamoeba histolytica HM-3:IMSS]ENY60414.1 hypothetical protein EHI7A_002090 [Entamoeba histolytica HM-1:IMSS-A]GAT96480.1 hypothetical protein CL6EHI_141010 [Entamoeba histolytica]|eukprot:XP_654604.1 hypothetical protein EHI_141010 [Entamoeba histolytica HM-1:IMSS]